MGLGKRIRLQRIFAHPSGRFFSVAFDHFIAYHEGFLPQGLRTIEPTLKKIVMGRPDAITIHKGLALSAWEPYAGTIPLILQSTAARADDTACEQIAEPSEAVEMGADAFAVVAFVRGKTEGTHLRVVAQAVRDAARFDLPVILHIYPRDFSSGQVTISTRPEDVAWAVRCAVETGVDVIKVPYCGDIKAFRQIVAECPLPVVAAGGPKTDTLLEALEMMRDVIASGARGATVGRNVWEIGQVTEVIQAFKAVIHEQMAPNDALGRYGL